jgi:hypothetical protein
VELHAAWNQYWYLFIAGGSAVALQLGFAFVCWRHYRRLRHVDGRIAHLSAAVALLTDTMEGGLHDVAREVARLTSSPAASAVAAPRNRTATQRRVRSASKRGRTVRDIAASEQMSEGEVRLMLQMSGRDGRETPTHAEMR